MLIVMAYTPDFILTFPQLVMKQIERIQDITSKELRNMDKTLKNALGEQVIESEDTRYSFLQAVETLGSMLSPYFGNMMKEEGCDNLFDDFCEYYDTELVELMNNEEFKKRVKDMFDRELTEAKDDEEFRNQVNLFLLNDKVKEGRKMFRKLVNVFKSNDFLREADYGDSAGGAQDSSLEAVIDELDEGSEIGKEGE